MTTSSISNRSYPLDALRGFAILTMVLSGVIPYGVLPAWMYHAQLPPPAHKFNPNLPGFTWVDLVFPLFLFALGAAIPMALSRRIQQGDPYPKIMFSIVERGFLLGFFAIFLRHVRPHVIDPSPNTGAWLISMVGFSMMFLIFTRLTAKWNHYLTWGIRLIGWLGAIALLALLRYPDGTSFSLYRSDIIIVVLTNMAVFGSFIWLMTQNRLLVRLGILGFLLAIRLAHTEIGWVKWLWNFSPIPWVYKLYYLQYLFIVIPGTIIGDLLVRFMQRPLQDPPIQTKWSAGRWMALAGLMISLLVLMLIGLQARWLWQTTILAFGLCGLARWLVRHPSTEIEALIKTLLGWGIYWLLLGLIFEPYEGGIKKDHPTLSYYFVTTGLSIFLLIAFAVLIDIFKKKGWFQILIDNGQNPMIAYVGFANFIWPILALTGLEEIFLKMTPTPWLGFLRGVFYTLLLALMVSFFTRRKIFWRT